MNSNIDPNQVLFDNIFDSLTDSEIDAHLKVHGINMHEEANSLSKRVKKLQGQMKLAQGKVKRKNLDKAKAKVKDFIATSTDPIKDLLNLFAQDEKKLVYFRDLKELTPESALEMLEENELLEIMKKLEVQEGEDGVE